METEHKHTKILKNQYIPTAEFYSQVIDSLQDYCIFTVDNELIINSWNSGATNIFGYETDEIIGKHFHKIFTDEDKKSGVPEKEIVKAIKDGRAVDNRWHLRKDESTFYANGLVFPLTGKDGQKLGFVKILRDITGQKNSEASLKEYVKEMEDLVIHKDSILAIVSHDLRSPLAGIIGTSEYLKGNFEKMQPEKVKEMLNLLYESAKEQLNTLDYLVEWARIKYASEAFSPSKIELVGYVKQVFDRLNDTAALKMVNLHHEIEEKENIFADGKMLLSVLQNIVSNAITHTRSGGKITVKAKRIDNEMIIEIKDMGDGMSKEIQEKLFTPQIESLSQARKTDKGAGIGLLLVKGFLEKNGGKIWVESIEGVGSSFYFSLPTDKHSDN